MNRIPLFLLQNFSFKYLKCKEKTGAAPRFTSDPYFTMLGFYKDFAQG
jgi:hypothetical protein